MWWESQMPDQSPARRSAAIPRSTSAAAGRHSLTVSRAPDTGRATVFARRDTVLVAETAAEVCWLDEPPAQADRIGGPRHESGIAEVAAAPLEPAPTDPFAPPVLACPAELVEGAP